MKRWGWARRMQISFCGDATRKQLKSAFLYLRRKCVTGVIRHSRAGGNPIFPPYRHTQPQEKLGSRLRGSDGVCSFELCFARSDERRVIAQLRHSREGGNPIFPPYQRTQPQEKLGSRLRGSDGVCSFEFCFARSDERRVIAQLRHSREGGNPIFSPHQRTQPQEKFGSRLRGRDGVWNSKFCPAT
jgi:hypothetical protein